MKKLITTFLSLSLVVIMAIPMVGCGNPEDQTAKATSYVSLDINPSIELTLDQNDKVISVCGTNEDGKVLLYGETEIVGADVEKAIEIITDLAVQMGYISEENKVVDTSVSSANEEKAQAILSKVNAKVVASADKVGIQVKTEGKGVYSLVRKFEQFKAENPDNQLIQNLTLEKFRLALSASETGEITIEAAIELPLDELVECISKGHEKAKDYATDAFKKAEAEAKIVYERALGQVLDLLYINVADVQGARYAGYKFTARMLKGVAKAISFAENASSYELPATTVQEIMTALDIEDVTLLQNQEGKVTLDSVYIYVDKLFKNLPEGTDAEQVKTQIDAILDQIELGVKEQVKIAVAVYEDDIDDLLLDIDDIMEEVQEKCFLIPGIPDSIKEVMQQEINALIAEFDVVEEEIEAMAEDGLTCEELIAYADKMEEKANKVLAEIEANLSDSERELIESKKELAEGLTAVKAELDNSIKQYREREEQRLLEMKQQRLHPQVA